MSDRIRCSRCEQFLPSDAFAPSQRKPGSWCRACRREYMRPYHAARYEPRPLHGPPAPPRQPRELVTHGGKPSGPRWRRLQAQVWAEETHCALCGGWVDQTLDHNDRMARSLDHVIPIAYGGAMYDRGNVRLAHRSCNSKAGRAQQDERLLYTRAALWLGTQLGGRHGEPLRRPRLAESNSPIP